MSYARIGSEGMVLKLQRSYPVLESTKGSFQKRSLRVKVERIAFRVRFSLFRNSKNTFREVFFTKSLSYKSLSFIYFTAFYIC